MEKESKEAIRSEMDRVAKQIAELKAMQPKSIDKRVNQLVAGDVLSGSGALVLGNPIDVVYMSQAKSKILIQYPNGKVKYAYWGRQTTVGVKIKNL